MELFKRTSTGSWHPFCCGSIIGDRWILTVAHCVDATATDRIVVGVGSNTLDSGGTVHRVQEAVRHENYNGNAAGDPNDIGVLKLTTPIAYTPLVQPIALPDPPAYPSGTATVTGWGKTSGNGEASNTLQQATVTLLTVAECQVRWYGQNINANHVCTYGKGTGVSACGGDSGDPSDTGIVYLGADYRDEIVPGGGSGEVQGLRRPRPHVRCNVAPQSAPRLHHGLPHSHRITTFVPSRVWPEPVEAAGVHLGPPGRPSGERAAGGVAGCRAPLGRLRGRGPPRSGPAPTRGRPGSRSAGCRGFPVPWCTPGRSA
ncbi:serine protease, partial [Streptomyces sp. NPDC059247]|uniref:serine protease n=1 Tax=Streptomyces sp. NPDC059247 TaxID=3346790 RepID=UPI0036C32A07